MLAKIEDAIIARCQEVAGEHVKAVEDLPGRWNDKTLRAALRQVPGIYVAWSGARGENGASRATATGRYVVYVVTGHASGHRERRRGNVRQVGAYELLERVVPAVHGLAVDGIGTLLLETIDNLYSEQFDKEGVVIYGVAYRMKLVFPGPRDAAELADFATFHATHQVGDGPDTESHLELPTEESP